ncbi:hypothetical protein D9758_016147 [Tetrapyrgos nigripes]|uniref:Uncharacterized protein n=1 Tax=Tetrapyrgos nigripes TaxID=182062 RepID=A0A8H5CB63_9AGAR|nr:hypothetical protein D9758_016147 [Tetrapyrgos nigripes]
MDTTTVGYIFTNPFDIYYTLFLLSSSSLTVPGPTPYPDFNVTPPAFPYFDTNNPHPPHPSPATSSSLPPNTV